MAEQRYPCTQCGRSYKTKFILGEHIRDKHGDEAGAHVCPVPECGGRRYYNKSSLTDHIQRVHEDRRPHACTLCERAYVKAKELAVHIRQKHTGERPFKCTHANCSKTFASTSDRVGHLRTHSAVKPHVCPFCKDKSFRTRAELVRHSRVHTGEKPFACQEPGCGKTFSHAGNLSTHMMGHTGEKSHYCSYCSYKTNNAHALEGHMRSHTGEKPYACTHDQCGKSFAQKHFLKQHMRAMHTDPDLKLGCNLCDKKYGALCALKTHIRKKHSTTHKKFTCRICKEELGDRTSLRDHTKTHHPKDMQFSCDFCPHRCATYWNLVSHHRTHTGEKPFSCEECGKQVVSRNSLMEHQKTHAPVRVKEYGCEWCPMHYHNKYHLQGHLRRCKQRPEYREAIARRVEQNKATGEHAFFCDICALPFLDSKRLNTHLKTHDSGRERRFKCDLCGKRFFYAKHLRRHESTSKKCGRILRQRQESHIDHDNTNSEPSAAPSKLKLRELRVVLKRLTTAASSTQLLIS